MCPFVRGSCPAGPHQVPAYGVGKKEKHLGLSTGILTSDFILPVGWDIVRVPKS